MRAVFKCRDQTVFEGNKLNENHLFFNPVALLRS